MGVRIENEPEDKEVTFEKNLNEKVSLSLHTLRNEGDYIGVSGDKEAEVELEYEMDEGQSFLIRFDEEESMMGLKKKYEF